MDKQNIKTSIGVIGGKPKNPTWDEIQNKPNFATVATSGDYDDLENKPNLATVATSGDYDDLNNKPTIPTVNDATITLTQDGVTKGSFTLNQGSDGTIDLTGGISSVSWNDVTDKPNFATVATSGDYDDLSNKPTIPAAQIQADWNQTDSTALDYIKNKPVIMTEWYGTQAEFEALGTYDDNTNYHIESELAEVATTGSYNDLIDKPTIPSAPTVTDGDQTLSWGTRSTIGNVNGTDIHVTMPSQPTFTQTQANWNETDSSSAAYIQNKPVIPSATTVTDGDQTLSWGTRSAIGNVNGTDIHITMPSQPTFSQTQANWNETDATSAAYIQNKPTIPTVPSNLVTGSGSSYTVWTGTQAAYDALGTYDASTLYFITA